MRAVSREIFNSRELRLRRRKAEGLGEDRRGRPWFRPQGIQRQKRAHFLRGHVRRPVERPNSHDNRHFVPALNDDRVGSQWVSTGRGSQLIDDFLQEGPGCGVANEKTPVLDLDVVVENGLGGGVHLVNKSVLVEGDRGQAHCIERR